jgi:lysylphosphatidylglycerol synthetase-like protein (DUF2156 family)
VTTNDHVRAPGRRRARPALTLLTGIALAAGYLAGRHGRRAASPAADPGAGPNSQLHEQAASPSHPVSPAGSLELRTDLRRVRPDVLLGPVLLVMIGIIVDRLRESGAGESVTAWLLIIGATVAAMLARSAGYRWAARGYYCFLVGFSWAAAALYVRAGLGAVPQAWISSTVAASLLWLAVDVREGIERAPRGRKVRAALAAGRRWLGFVVAWAVLAQLVYQYVSRTLADPEPHPVWARLSVAVVAVLGGAAIIVMTVPRRDSAPGAARARQSAR